MTDERSTCSKSKWSLVHRYTFEYSYLTVCYHTYLGCPNSM